MDISGFFRAKEKEGDLRSEEGILICGVCGEPKERRIDGVDFPVVTLCECDRRALEERGAADREQEKIQERIRVKEAVGRCFCELGPDGVRKAENMTFKKDRWPDSRQSVYCRRYADGFGDVLRENVGLVLYGPVGSGKTFLASCVCSRVIEKGYTARFLNLGALAQKSVSIKETEREEAREAIMTPDLIVLDDLGVERRSEYMDEAVYTVVNARYMANKPAIFTTNLRTSDFENPKDERQKRIYSRIVGMCDFVPVNGPDRRIGEHNIKKNRIGKILKGAEQNSTTE
ncbi:MAG: ATP-binding protein [Clostridia bacterium]|nr:ATP-binding protein [Clostridia bacterium]